MKNSQVYEKVTAAILESIDKDGLLPWQKRWDGKLCLPQNGVSGHVYSGVNVWLTLAQGYDSPYWVTYRQCQKIRQKNKKAGIIPGELKNFTEITFWKSAQVKDKDNPEKKRKILLCRTYRVFNWEQCQNMPEPVALKGVSFERIDGPEKIMDDSPVRPKIRIGPRAQYSPAIDKIEMPDPKAFETPDSYYHTLFHEMAHATGHPTRLDRDLSGIFGDDKYSKEELIAEMCAAFLSAVAGIDPDIDNTAAYIKGWRSKFANDPGLIISAASAAQKAANLILGIKFEKPE